MLNHLNPTENMKFSFAYKEKPSVENYWEYCIDREIPFIEISPIDEEYVNISYDLLPCLPYEKLKGDLLDEIVTIYKSYFTFFNLPMDKFKLIGNSIALIIAVKKEHHEIIANQLYEFLLHYLKENKVPI